MKHYHFVILIKWMLWLMTGDMVTDIEECHCDHNLSIVQRDRNYRGGGVAILRAFCVHQDLSKGHIESLWIELFPYTKRAVLLCCVYRSPSNYHFYDHLIMECEKHYYVHVRSSISLVIWTQTCLRFHLRLLNHYCFSWTSFIFVSWFNLQLDILLTWY